MTAIAVTGHLNLTGETVPLVRAELRRLLAERGAGPLTGLSCLAPGADTLFADEVLAAGGRLVAVLPSMGYRRAFAAGQLADLDRLLAAAAEVVIIPRPEPDDLAYQQANAELLRRADLLVAVWDGLPGSGPGGTADAVAAARRSGVPVLAVWPTGAARAVG
ncbi:hypothetical protein [Kitasatospora sp. NPDC059571]|uniref:hypothetical protein n=1 Tax=Kitasatospora sp. NPDC059571 TaxID=3346871 RepID=UPI0036B3948F